MLEGNTQARIGEERITAIINEIDNAMGNNYLDEIVDISPIFTIVNLFGKTAYEMIQLGILHYENGNWNLEPRALKSKSITSLRVYNARVRLKLSKEEMAKALGISTEEYQRKEDGYEEFSENDIKSVAAISGLEVEYFWANDQIGIKEPDKIYINGLKERIMAIEQSNKH